MGGARGALVVAAGPSRLTAFTLCPKVFGSPLLAVVPGRLGPLGPAVSTATRPSWLSSRYSVPDGTAATVVWHCHLPRSRGPAALRGVSSTTPTCHAAAATVFTSTLARTNDGRPGQRWSTSTTSCPVTPHPTPKLCRARTPPRHATASDALPCRRCGPVRSRRCCLSGSTIASTPLTARN